MATRRQHSAPTKRKKGREKKATKIDCKKEGGENRKRKVSTSLRAKGMDLGHNGKCRAGI